MESRPWEEIAARLALDAAGSEVIEAFNAHGIPSILLKGPAMAHWLYANEEATRTYLDIDLLVPPHLVTAAEQVLRNLGFEHEPLDDLAHDRPWHAHYWYRPVDGAAIDLHRTLIGADPAIDIHAALAPDIDTLDLRGHTVAIPGTAALALHAALHAAQNGPAGHKSLRDLDLALRQPIHVWVEASHLADRLGATSAFVAGLRLHPDGRSVLAVVDAPMCAKSVDVALRAQGASPAALGVAWLMEAPSLRDKLSLIVGKVVPPRAFMRAWTPLYLGRPMPLAVAYPARWWYLAKELPSAVSQWLRARRSL